MRRLEYGGGGDGYAREQADVDRFEFKFDLINTFDEEHWVGGCADGDGGGQQVC